MKTTLHPKDIKKINERISYLEERALNLSDNARPYHLAEIGYLRRCLILHLEVCRRFPDEQEFEEFRHINRKLENMS